MKRNLLPLLAALLLSSGCMTCTVIDNARNPELTDHVPWANYFLIPITVPADIITAPIQIVAFGASWRGESRAVHGIPLTPSQLTMYRMEMLKRCVLEFAKEHGRLPHSLTELSSEMGYDPVITDGWNKPIIFEESPTGIVTFRSLGGDGVAGGSGDDADIVRSFASRDAKGAWSNKTVEWNENLAARNELQKVSGVDR